ncbi:MAG TPA: c-type cytochrome [Trueperaceae bacterium]|nr:c-type cytochrome [Trueperaceae bacterium]
MRVRRVRKWVLIGGAVVAATALAAGLELQGKPIEVAASGYAVPEVSSVANGQSVPLESEGPGAEAQDWTFAPTHTVAEAGGSNEVKGIATFFSGPDYKPAFPNVLLPNADEGTTTATLTYQGSSVDIPVTVTPAPEPDVKNGKQLYDQNCAMCHGAQAEGVGDFPNLTYTDAGVGGWTVSQFNRAVRVGVDDEGATLAQTMPRWQANGFKTDFGHPPSAQEVSDIFGYLKTLQ